MAAGGCIAFPLMRKRPEVKFTQRSEVNFEGRLFKQWGDSSTRVVLIILRKFVKRLFAGIDVTLLNTYSAVAAPVRSHGLGSCMLKLFRI